MGGDLPKQYIEVAGVTIFEHSLRALLACGQLTAVVVALHPEDVRAANLAVLDDARVQSVVGGASRSDSVLAGLDALAQQAAADDWVLVHDAARPCLQLEDCLRLIARVTDSGIGGILAEPVVDTVKRAGADGLVAATLDRKALWRAQTPQMFRLGELREALAQAAEQGLAVTDEASAMEMAGYPVQLIRGSSRNLKVTVPTDLQLAAWYLGNSHEQDKLEKKLMRIGHGYDVHRFSAGDEVVLGGVHIPHRRGLEAHSDGDVLIHAVCDALLGAIGEGDIGRHFPDTEPVNAGIDSRLLLRRVIQLVHQAGWVLANMDATLVAQAPKMAPHIAAMRENLAADMAAHPAQVNVKATTTEKLGFTGREEGIAAHAVVLLQAGTPAR
jgi:2-C-methyl-D-erythritol 2,4-cyclodiphosphate synthase/2-C-methyl-D-erythritol 4-phosphate cytidylyltransferase